MTSAREQEVAAGLAAVRRRIAEACARSGRRPEEVVLVVVTKLFPASDVRILHGLGVRDVGESRHQEGVAKRRDCDDLDLRWHFVGRLQTNKAAAVGAWADAVHSVDRARLLPPLSRAAVARRRPLDVLVQVSLDPPDATAGRGGVAPADAPALAGEVAAAEGLRLRGVMGVAPRGGDPAAAFALLHRAALDVRRVAPEAGWVSAGMSGDLEAAIARGATHVRVGSAVLGNRPAHG